MRDNPNWWVTKMVDGFGAHTLGLTAMKVYRDNNIILAKEEADCSHICQAYDKHVAKLDKKTGRYTLGLLLKEKRINGGIVDQWGLVHVGLMIVRSCLPEVWTSSFHACNLCLSTRVSFPEWIHRITSDVQARGIFKPPSTDDMYQMLPSLWHGLTPQERHAAASIVEKHGDIYTVECVQQIVEDCPIPLKDLDKLRMCISVAKDFSDFMTRQHGEDVGLKPVDDANAGVAPELLAAQALVKPITDGLSSFELKPKDLEGLSLLSHMLQFARRMTPKDEKLQPTPGLGLEITAENQMLMDPSHQLRAEWPGGPELPR
jgi:hypothetical protein